MIPFTGVSLFLLFFVVVSEGACPNGWMRHGQMCYHFSNEVENWASAKVICEAMKGQLVEIETAEENYFLGQQAKLNNHRNYWIALSDVIEEGIWVWMNTLTPVQFTQWHRNEPNNDGTENCVDLYPDGDWNDAKCRDNQYYICEKVDETTEIVGK
ncbi:hypothetical protein ACF0H5_017320 [Mactra antiquata]